MKTFKRKKDEDIQKKDEDIQKKDEDIVANVENAIDLKTLTCGKR